MQREQGVTGCAALLGTDDDGLDGTAGLDEAVTGHWLDVDRTQREREQARPLPRPLAAPTPHSSPSPNPNHISRITSPPQALHAFRKGQPPTLVATDVAVRRLRL